MPVGTQLGVLRAMLNAEAGEEIDESVSTARVALNNQLLNNQQSFLDSQYSNLRGKTNASLSLAPGVRYYTPPTGIDLDRLIKPAFTNLAAFRYEVEYGIGPDEYNAYDSNLGVQSSPALRWDLTNVNGSLQIEIWPVPDTAQTFQLYGVLPLTQMVNDTDTCVIDDLALVLFTAAEILFRKKQGDAQAKLAKANLVLNTLKASFPSKYETFNMGGGTRWPLSEQMQRPVVAVNLAGH